MLYAVLIYDLEAEVGDLPSAQLDDLINRHGKVQQQLAAQDRLGPVVRLLPTTSAKTQFLKCSLFGRFATCLQAGRISIS